jgi:hypothetical protein
MLYVALLLGCLRRALRPRSALVLENLALRQQLAVYQRRGARPGPRRWGEHESRPEFSAPRRVGLSVLQERRWIIIHWFSADCEPGRVDAGKRRGSKVTATLTASPADRCEPSGAHRRIYTY